MFKGMTLNPQQSVSGKAALPSFSAYDDALSGLAPQPVNPNGVSFSGISFQGGGNLPLIQNASPVAPQLPIHMAQTDLVISSATMSSPLTVTPENFAKAWGGGGPQTGQILMSI